MNPFGEPSLVALRDAFAMHGPAMTPEDAFTIAGRPRRTNAEQWWAKLSAERRAAYLAEFRYLYADAMIRARGP